MLLKVSDLAVIYSSSPEPTIQNVNFSLERGEILSIVGESGSGKTTVARAILGCLPVSGSVAKGDIVFDNQSLLTRTKQEWLNIRGKHISMIFQDSGNMMNPIQTIGKQFIEYIQIHSDMNKQQAYDKAVEMLTRMDLANADNIMQSYLFELSGGMRQRVGIAMAITFEPQLLLADEPTSALDVTTQAQIVMQLMDIRKTFNTAIILVTHNIGVASYMSDKIMVMQHGRVVEYGEARKIIDSPRAAYTKELLASVPRLGGRYYE